MFALKKHEPCYGKDLPIDCIITVDCGGVCNVGSNAKPVADYTDFREKYPVTDTWIMPAIGTVLIDVAAVFNLLCVWPWRERSVLNIVAAVLVIPIALLFTLIVVGEILGGA